MSRAWLRLWAGRAAPRGPALAPAAALLVGCGLLLGGSLAVAAPVDLPRCDDEERAPRVTIKRGPRGEKRVVIEEPLVVCGRRHKPNAFYVLERARIEYRNAELERSFVPRIPTAVRRSPF